MLISFYYFDKELWGIILEYSPSHHLSESILMKQHIDEHTWHLKSVFFFVAKNKICLFMIIRFPVLTQMSAKSLPLIFSKICCQKGAQHWLGWLFIYPCLGQGCNSAGQPSGGRTNLLLAFKVQENLEFHAKASPVVCAPQAGQKQKFLHWVLLPEVSIFLGKKQFFM